MTVAPTGEDARTRLMVIMKVLHDEALRLYRALAPMKLARNWG